MKIRSFLRLKFNYFDSSDFDIEVNRGDSDLYEESPSLNGFGLVGQLGSGMFSLLFGIYRVDNEINLSGSPFGLQQVGNSIITFSGGDSVSGRAEFNDDIVPYLGVGLSLNMFGLFDLIGDVGAMFLGSVTVEELSFQTSTTISDEDIEIERENIREDLNRYEVYPVARVGISIKF